MTLREAVLEKATQVGGAWGDLLRCVAELVVSNPSLASAAAKIAYAEKCGCGRRVRTSLTIDEVSAVTEPANEHCRAVMLVYEKLPN